MRSKVLILIPARFSSTRFPGKPLALISGVPMINRVYQTLNKKFCEGVETKVCVVTDHSDIQKTVQESGGLAVMVADETESGTERIQLAYERHFSDDQYDLIINVQGDEPLIDKTIIERLIHFHLNSSFDITTMVRAEEGIAEEPNIVKAIWCEGSGRGLYFSRAAVPFGRNNPVKKHFAHVGVYSFRPKALNDFCQFSVGQYEKTEGLEQLRALENGQTIGAIKITEKLLGVDCPEDIQKVEELLNE